MHTLQHEPVTKMGKWAMGVCVCVFFFVSTVFSKSVASGFVATQVISSQQKIEVTTIIPYASESMIIESSGHMTCLKQQDNQYSMVITLSFSPVHKMRCLLIAH
jgi:uncharacterized oligopeptide transporter (OPT) family protein